MHSIHLCVGLIKQTTVSESQCDKFTINADTPLGCTAYIGTKHYHIQHPYDFFALDNLHQAEQALDLFDEIFPRAEKSEWIGVEVC